jgi:hypothetical protein
MRGRAILINDEYAVKIEPERDSTGKITNGLMIGSTLLQNQGLIVLATKGEFKEMPALGAGIEGLLLDNDYLEWRRKIRLQLELDKQTVNEIKFNSVDNLVIDAVYNNQ